MTAAYNDLQGYTWRLLDLVGFQQAGLFFKLLTLQICLSPAFLFLTAGVYVSIT